MGVFVFPCGVNLSRLQHGAEHGPLIASHEPVAGHAEGERQPQDAFVVRKPRPRQVLLEGILADAADATELIQVLVTACLGGPAQTHLEACLAQGDRTVGIGIGRERGYQPPRILRAIWVDFRSVMARTRHAAITLTRTPSVSVTLMPWLISPATDTTMNGNM